MNIQLARRMREIRTSEIRELLKLTQDPEILSFAGGLPASETFPTEQLEEISCAVLREHGSKALQYSTTEGHPPLRQAIARRMTNIFSVPTEPENVLITSGSQQGLDLIGKVFIDEGDVVLTESPTYIGAISAFKPYGPKFVEMATDENGVIPEYVERTIKQYKKIKFIYILPDFQNPTGKSLPLERRREFMEIINRYQIPVVEDNPYGELCFEGDPLPALKSLDELGLVVLLGTFSKIFCPGLRIAWMLAEKELYDKFVMVKQGTDLHTSTYSQYIIGEFMERYGMAENVNKIISVYRERRNTMISSMEKEFPKEVTFTRPRGGLFLWAEMPEGINARDVMLEALKQKVAFVPGGSFFPNGGHENTLRLNFSAMPQKKIEEGIKRLGKVLHKAVLSSSGKQFSSSPSPVV